MKGNGHRRGRDPGISRAQAPPCQRHQEQQQKVGLAQPHAFQQRLEVQYDEQGRRRTNRRNWRSGAQAQQEGAEQACLACKEPRYRRRLERKQRPWLHEQVEQRGVICRASCASDME